MAEKKKDQEFLEFIVQALCDHPEVAKIERKVDEMGVLLSLRVHKDDMGQIIGKKGQTIAALRHLLRVIGFKHHARVMLKVEEPIQ